MATFKLNPKKKGMWKGKSMGEIEHAKAAAKKSGNVTREREATFAINAKHHFHKEGIEQGDYGMEIDRETFDKVDQNDEVETQSPEELFTLRDMIVAAASDKPDEFKSMFDAGIQDYLTHRVHDQKVQLQNSFLGVENQPETEEEGSVPDGEEADGHTEAETTDNEDISN